MVSGQTDLYLMLICWIIALNTIQFGIMTAIKVDSESELIRLFPEASPYKTIMVISGRKLSWHVMGLYPKTIIWMELGSILRSNPRILVERISKNFCLTNSKSNSSGFARIWQIKLILTYSNSAGLSLLMTLCSKLLHLQIQLLRKTKMPWMRPRKSMRRRNKKVMEEEG